MRLLAAFGLGLAVSAGAHADDLFVGVFESETRANYGSDIPGEYRIEVTRTDDGKYRAVFSRLGKQGDVKIMVPCPLELDAYRPRRPAGRGETLCHERKPGHLFPAMTYSENGLNLPTMKLKGPVPKGVELKESDLIEERHHQAKYYASVSWYFYAFRKVGQ